MDAENSSLSNPWSTPKPNYCHVCNNLQPYNHRYTFPNSPSRFLRDQRVLNACKKAASLPTLVLEDIRISRFLSEKDSCHYCAFICEVLNVVCGNDWPVYRSSKGQVYGDQRSITLNIREGLPLIISCLYFHRDPNWAHPRDDIEVFTDYIDSGNSHSTVTSKVQPTSLGHVGESKRSNGAVIPQCADEDAVKDSGSIGPNNDKEATNLEQTMGRLKLNEKGTNEDASADSSDADAPRSSLPSAGQGNKSSSKSPCAGPAMPRAKSADDDQATRWIQDRLLECRTEHEMCTATDPDFAPRRVIALGSGNDNIKLQETVDLVGKVGWVALSHCWGMKGLRMEKLLIENEAARKANISFDTLPPTFQDGITVSRRLGFQYIWIDSLCIVQDSKEDWQEQCKQMGQIYACAALVVSADSSWSPYSSFLCERIQSWWGDKEVLFRSPDGECQSFKARRRQVLINALEYGNNEPPYTSAWASLRREGRLAIRAWCFQESFLARRILHFHEGGFVYECKKQRCVEGSVPPWPSTEEGSVGEYDEVEKWHMIVKAYSRRKLTYASDRLPAISGIAAAFAERRPPGIKYLSGLWSDTVILDLLWRTMPVFNHIPLAQRKPVAPSWSWASLERSGVIYHTYSRWEPLVTYESHEIMLAGDNPFGEVVAGVIRLTCRMISCFVRYDPIKAEHFAYLRHTDGSKGSEHHFFSDGLLIPVEDPTVKVEDTTEPSYSLRRGVIGEDWDKAFEDMRAFFIPVIQTPFFEFQIVGVLLGVTSRGLPQRIGCLMNVPSEWYSRGEEHTILLV